MISAQDLRTSLPEDVKEATLRRVHPVDGRQPTGDLADLLLWNVVIAFFVNVAASGFFEDVKSLFENRGRLTKAELRQFAAELAASCPVVVNDDTTAAARNAIEAVLKDYGIVGPQGAQAASDVLAALSRRLD